VWTEFVRAVRGTMGGPSRRGSSHAGMRSDERPPEGSAADGRRVLVAFEEGADRGRTARYFRSLGWTVDVREAREDSQVGLRGHDLAIVDLTAAPHEVAFGFDRLVDIRRVDPGAIVIVLGDLSAAMETEARTLGVQAVVRAPHYLPDLGHLAFSLTRVFHG
jgi:hypothetical protein